MGSDVFNILRRLAWNHIIIIIRWWAIILYLICLIFFSFRMLLRDFMFEFNIRENIIFPRKMPILFFHFLLGDHHIIQANESNHLQLLTFETQRHRIKQKWQQMVSKLGVNSYNKRNIYVAGWVGVYLHVDTYIQIVLCIGWK